MPSRCSRSTALPISAWSGVLQPRSRLVRPANLIKIMRTSECSHLLSLALAALVARGAVPLHRQADGLGQHFLFGH